MLRKFLGRLVSQAIVIATGILGLLIAVIRDLWFPNANPLPYYLVLLVLSVIFGSFKVFADIQNEFEVERRDKAKQIAQLEQELAELKSNQPKLDVGFGLRDGDLRTSQTITLRSMKPFENIDELLEKKRRELLERFPERPKNYPTDVPKFEVAHDIANMMSGFTTVLGIDKYIEELRTFYIESRIWDFYHERGILIYPLLKNSGLVTANSITLEFILPQVLVLEDKPSRDKVYWSLTEDDSKPKPPEDPTWHSLMVMARPGSPMTEFLTPVFNDLNTQPLPDSGPFYSFVEGNAVVTYTCQKLLQGRLKDNLDPFLIWLGDLEAPIGIRIETKIFAEELRPSPQSSELELEIRFDNANTTEIPKDVTGP